MNIQEYIESGILEAYVLGTLTEEECSSVADTIKLYPQLSQEVKAIEEALLSFAEINAIQPPDQLQNSIWSAIEEAGQLNKPPIQIVSKQPLEVPVRSRQFKWARAAVWVGLIGSLLANVLLWNERRAQKEEQVSLVNKVNQMSAKQQQLQAKLTLYDREHTLLSDPNIERVIMQSVDPNRTMTGMVMYNKAGNALYVSMQHMPVPPAGKQYQLWVIQAGQPVSLGLISNDVFFQDARLQKISSSSIQDGQAFAVSLEKQGGSVTPTEVMVLGKIPS